jgi:hypothetical protein
MPRDHVAQLFQESESIKHLNPTSKTTTMASLIALLSKELFVARYAYNGIPSKKQKDVSRCFEDRHSGAPDQLRSDIETQSDPGLHS